MHSDSFDFLLSSTVLLCVYAKSLSRVWLCVTLWAVTHQVPLFMILQAEY